ncbi:MAG: BamA/TamA family outer membrane protein [Sulfurimonas sp.]|uniref:autotransporter assembly complex protein TamA n=1 Tax=Sulfurimonas sp. TaxID=2022749 RepID=UPI00262CE5EA|nr:outer membrane protein assembly factor [Sulfurimonas sp.]MDD2653424.1 BamA/TamA family outer membrane protein [Sulfurimonas sp.]MDD3451605.1 BamA/TamA family outer membrane protein [Sulfurimonas sp.]
MKKKFYLLLFFSTLLFGEKLQLIFSGNHHISSSSLYESLDLREPSFYEFYKEKPSIDERTLELIIQTLKEYYKTRGFFGAEIASKKEDSNIVLTIKENEPVIIKHISNHAELDFNGVIPFKVGDFFDSNKFTQSKKEIRHFYANNSYCNASVDAKAWIDKERNEAYLHYESSKNKECYFGDIEVVPSKNIDKEIVHSLLLIRKGEEFSSESITKSYEELYAYEGVSKAIIDTEVVKENQVNATVSIIQNENPLRFEFGIGASSDEGAAASVGLLHRNFLGNLKTLSLKGKVAQIKQNAILAFDMPLANHNFTGFETGYENERFLGFKEYKFFSTLYLKQKRGEHVLKESIIFDQINTYQSDDEALFPLNKLFIVSPKLEYAYDTRDKILDPSSGYFIKGEITASQKSTISDATYHKFKVGGGKIYSLEGTILALRAEYGTLSLTDGALPTSYRFFAGGMHSNRGYGYREIGPTNSLGDPLGFDSIMEATAELRFKIYGDFGGVIFNDNSYVGESSAPNYANGYHSAGFGIRYKTPIGPIAVDIGCDVEDPLEHYAFHFHIGELF